MYSWYMQNAVVPVFPALCTSSTASSSTKVQASSMTANTILVAYQLTAGLYTGLSDMLPGCDTNNYY